MDWLIPGLVLAAISITLGLTLERGTLSPGPIGSSVDEKLNALIWYEQQDAASRPSYLFLLGIGGTVVCVCIFIMDVVHGWHLFSGLAKHLNASCFYWGDEVPLYDRRTRLISNLMWVLFGGFLVFLIAGVIVAMSLR